MLKVARLGTLALLGLASLCSSRLVAQAAGGEVKPVAPAAAPAPAPTPATPAAVPTPTPAPVPAPATTPAVPPAPGAAAPVAVPTAPAKGATSILFVPAVISLTGEKQSYFTSEMTLTNRGATEATVLLHYTAFRGEGDGVIPNAEKVGPGRQLIIPDVVEYLRKKGLPLAAAGPHGGTLRVLFSGLSAPGDASVLVRTSTPVPPPPAAPSGRAGLTYPGVPTARLLSSPVYLCGLRLNEGDRSNIAIQNAGAIADGEIRLRVSFFNGDGAPGAKPTGWVEKTLKPGGFEQIAVGELISKSGARQGYVRVERISGSALFWTYAVINDQVTSDGSYVSPVALVQATSAPKAVILPAIVEAGSLTTEVVLANLSTSEKQLLLTFTSEAVKGGVAKTSFTLPAGTQVLVPSYIQTMRQSEIGGIPPVGKTITGPLVVTSSGKPLDGVVLAARVSRPGGGGHYGTFYGGVASGPLSPNTVWIPGLQQTKEVESEVAVLNTGEAGAKDITVKVEVFDGTTGSKAAERAVTLKPFQLVALKGLLSEKGGIANAFVKVTRTAGLSPFVAYGVVTDGAGDRSGDGAFVSSDPPNQ